MYRFLGDVCTQLSRLCCADETITHVYAQQQRNEFRTSLELGQYGLLVT